MFCLEVAFMRVFIFFCLIRIRVVGSLGGGDVWGRFFEDYEFSGERK